MNSVLKFSQANQGLPRKECDNLTINRMTLFHHFLQTRFRWGCKILTICQHILTACFITWAASSIASEFNGSGYIDYKATFPDTSQVIRTIFNERWNYVFGVSNNVWRIQLDDPEKGIKLDYSFDGTNTYVVIPSGTNFSAQIFPTQYPPPNGYPAIIVWFAYCSGAYLSYSTNNMLCSLAQEAHPYVTAYGRPVRSKLEWLDRALFVPQKCLQFNDGAYYGIDVTKQPPVFVGYKFENVFRNGFVEVAYNVSETTNTDGLTLPKAFQLQQFRPKEHPSSSNDVFTIAEFDGCLQNLELGASNIGGGAQAQRNALVDDYRGMKLNPPVELVRYFNPSSSWLPFSPGSMPYTQYENRKLVQKTFVAESRYKKSLIIAILVALTVIPLIVILAQRFFRQTSANKQ